MPALDHVPIILYSGPGRQRQRRTTDCQADGLQRIEFGIGAQTLNRYGHLYPDELDSLAERLEAVHERARAEAAATPARPSGAPTVARIGKAAGH